MRTGAVIVGLVAGASLLALADAAAAQSTRGRAPAVSLSEANAARAAATPPPATSRLRFTERGRWGLDLNLSQPLGRERDLSDVEAGAYYRVNPRLRLGASAGLAEPQADPAQPPQGDRRAAPRFRLESIFKF